MTWNRQYVLVQSSIQLFNGHLKLVTANNKTTRRSCCHGGQHSTDDSVNSADLLHVWYMVMFVWPDIFWFPPLTDRLGECCVPSERTVKRRLRLRYTLQRHQQLLVSNNKMLFISNYCRLCSYASKASCKIQQWITWNRIAAEENDENVNNKTAQIKCTRWFRGSESNNSESDKFFSFTENIRYAKLHITDALEHQCC